MRAFTLAAISAAIGGPFMGGAFGAGRSDEAYPHAPSPEAEAETVARAAAKRQRKAAARAARRGP